MRIIALSALCVDEFPEQGFIKPGGNSLNFAFHAKEFSTEEIAVAGYLGEDEGAKQILAVLKAKEINTNLLYIKKGKTASNKLYNTPDGERYSKPGEWNDGVFNNFQFSEADFSKILEYDIIAIPYTDNNLNRIIRRNKSGKNIVVDFLHFDDPKSILKYLPYIEIAFVSSTYENLEKLKKLAEQQHKLIVATLGARGSIAFHNGDEYFQDAIEVDKVIDTTGCGDAYQAAFSLSYFQNGNIKEAMLKGAQVASRVIKIFGGIG